MARTLSTYALASLDEMKRACGVDVLTVQAEGNNFLDNLFDSLEFASDEIERFLERHLVTRGALTEYHTADKAQRSELFLGQFPVISITSVTEGYWSAGAFVTGTTLIAGTDYINDAATGRLIRLSGADQYSWQSGFERVKVVYAAGYANTAAVPDKIARVCLALAARRFHEVNSQSAGVQSKTDGLGTVTRFLPAELLRMEQDALAGERRHYTTGRAA